MKKVRYWNETEWEKKRKRHKGPFKKCGRLKIHFLKTVQTAILW